MKKEQNSLKEAVYASILDSIIKKEFVSGEILNESSLTDLFGCSKAPIREALLLLCNEGVLRNIPRCGYEVIRLTGLDIKEIMVYRSILECALLERSFKSLQGKKLTELKKAAKRCQQKTNNVIIQWEANAAFHLLLAGFSGNTYACQQLEKAIKTLKIAYSQTYWSSWSEQDPAINIIDLHSDIICAIESNNSKEAVEALHKDLSSLRI